MAIGSGTAAEQLMSTGTIMSTLMASGSRVSDAHAPPVPLAAPPVSCGMPVDAPPNPSAAPAPLLLLPEPFALPPGLELPAPPALPPAVAFGPVFPGPVPVDAEQAARA